MALTTLSTELLVEGLNALFLRRMLGTDNNFISLLAMMETTDKKTETFPFIGDMPTFREWTDRRVVSKLSEATYSLTARDWENSVAFDMRDIQDEQIPMLARKVEVIADQSRRHAAQLLVDTIVGAQTAVGYDGVSFYNDAHPIRAEEGATQDNDFAATGTGSVADLQADYDAGHVAMSRFVDEGGQPFHGDMVGPDFLVMAPPELFRNWSTVLFSTTQPTNDGSNVYRGQGDLLTTSRLADTGDFYMHKVDGAMKPFIFLERQAIQTTNTMTHMETWKPTKEVIYGADARYTAGVGMWQYSISFT